MITVIDLKISNINSISRALSRMDIDHIVSGNPSDIAKADKLIFPGVGSFSEAMKRMKISGIDVVLKELVLNKKIPVFGICLGMQLFAGYGEEGGLTEGLGFIKGQVVYLRASAKGFRVPHIGWNEVRHGKARIFDTTPDLSCFYFLHSYEFIPEETVISGYTNYGADFVSFVQKGHIIGTQFHPEKSQKIGLQLLDNFCKGKF